MNNYRVLCVDGNSFTVSNGVDICSVVCRGTMRQTGIKPMAGDLVVLSEDKKAIEEILPRKNQIKKPPCANIDLLLIVVSEAAPKTELFFVDCLTQLCLIKDITPVVCLNKSDLCNTGLFRSIYGNLFPYFEVSSFTGEGFSDVSSYIADKATLLIGNSGVGKSSILNRLSPAASAKTDVLSTKIGRGKQTTRQVRFYNAEAGGIIADSAGYSSLDTVLDDLCVDADANLIFPEFCAYTEHCVWSDCGHTTDQGCAVLKAVKEGFISPARHDSYLKLRDIYLQRKKKRWD